MSEEEKLIEEKTENKTKDLTDEMLEDKNMTLDEFERKEYARRVLSAILQRL